MYGNFLIDQLIYKQFIISKETINKEINHLFNELILEFSFGPFLHDQENDVF